MNMRDLMRLVEGSSDDDGSREAWLWHGTSEPAETIRKDGLLPGRHGAVFLTDNPELAVEYAVTDQERTGNVHVTVARVKVAHLDTTKLVGDVDHTDAEDWRDSLRETDQCMYLGAISPQFLTVEEH